MYLVNTTLASLGNSANAQVEITAALTRVTSRDSKVDGLVASGVLMMVMMSVMGMGIAGIPSVEGEGVHEGTAIAAVGADTSGVLASGRGADKSEDAKLWKDFL